MDGSIALLAELLRAVEAVVGAKPAWQPVGAHSTNWSTGQGGFIEETLARLLKKQLLAKSDLLSFSSQNIKKFICVISIGTLFLKKHEPREISRVFCFKRVQSKFRCLVCRY